MHWELTEHEKSHYPKLIAKKIRMIPYFEKKIEEGDCKEGLSTTLLASDYKNLAVLPFILEKDTSTWHLLRKSAELEYSLFVRHQNGEKISKSLIDSANYPVIFIALAVGDFSLARKYAEVLGTIEDTDEEDSHPLGISISYSVKYVVIENRPFADRWLSELKSVIEQNRPYYGLYEALLGIHIQDAHLVNQGLKRLTDNYSDMFGDNEMFSQYTDERFLFLWGIGLVKLARHRGLDVKAIEPLIPQVLVDYELPDADVL